MDETNIKLDVLREGGKPLSESDQDNVTSQDSDEIQQGTESIQELADNTQEISNNTGMEEELSNSGQGTVSPAAPKRKRPRMEIELNLKLENDEEFADIWKDRTRVRRQVVKYEEQPITKPDSVKKKTKAKDRKDRIKYEDGEEQFVCETCHLPFMTIQALIMHRKKHLKVVKFTCALCAEVFDTNPELIKHKVVHNDEDRSFICKKCKAEFTHHIEYLKHKVTHQKAQEYKCIECGKQYNSKTGFYIHIETHFDRLVKCEICHQKFKMNYIKNHMKTHTDNVECVECGKMCSDSRSYKYHMISHTGVKMFQCLYCGKGFGNSAQRTTHTRTHTNERPFECEICHQKFKQKTDKMRHMDSHKAKKDVECDVCHKTFYHKDSLKHHMDIHNKTQKYKCNLCDRRFHTRSCMVSHIQRTHSSWPKYTCEPCGVSFKTLSDLLRHKKKKKHKNNEFGYNKRMKTEEVKLVEKSD